MLFLLLNIVFVIYIQAQMSILLYINYFQVLVKSLNDAQRYTDVILDQADHPIHSDLHFSEQHDYLYAMSDRKVSLCLQI